MSVPKEAYSVAAALLVGGVAGAGLGYWFGVKRTNEAYIDELQMLKADIRDLDTVNKRQVSEINDLRKSELVAVADGIAKTYLSDSEDPAEVAVAMVRPDGNIAYNKVMSKDDPPLTDETEPTQTQKDDWEEQNVFAKKSGDVYVIERYEHGDPDVGFGRSELTYYDGDGLMTTEKEELVDDSFVLVGDDALEQWGFKSGHPDMVYVRNERIGMDFEITRIRGKFTDFEPDDIDEEAELRHSHYRRFRDRDE